MSAYSPRMLNEGFLNKVSTAEGREKTAEYTGNYIRDRLRELSFARQIIPPENVGRGDCQISVNHDTMVKIVQLEPRSRAMVIDFRGQPEARFIRGPRAEVGFFTISSEIFQQTEQELAVYDFPITKVIEENSLRDLQEVEDREFTLHCEAAVQALQAEANGGSATPLSNTTVNAGTVVEFSITKGQLARQTGNGDTTTVRPIMRPDFVNLFKLIDGNLLRCERILLTEPDYDDVLQWTVDDNGDKIQSETTVEGYKYNKLLGRAFVRTIKTNILRPGNVYAFTSPEYLGKFFVLNATKFYIDKVANRISFQAWEDIGMHISNVASIRKLELYGADANPSTGDADQLAQVRPSSEQELGAVNNRVDEGLFIPQVVSY